LLAFQDLIRDVGLQLRNMEHFVDSARGRESQLVCDRIHDPDDFIGPQ
jgi:hypothetical protein